MEMSSIILPPGALGLTKLDLVILLIGIALRGVVIIAALLLLLVIGATLVKYGKRQWALSTAKFKSANLHDWIKTVSGKSVEGVSKRYHFIVGVTIRSAIRGVIVHDTSFPRELYKLSNAF